MDEEDKAELATGEKQVTAIRDVVQDVKRQFTDWPFPEPIRDIGALGWQRAQKQYDIALDHDLLWPGRAYRPDLRILIAGCGTQEAAIEAFNNPLASVVGIDLSESSLACQMKLRRKHYLQNLKLHALDLLDVATLRQKFDLIVSFGVLHHLPDPAIGLSALGEVLADDGVMLISMYSKYPRAGVSMVQEALRRLSVAQNPAGIDFTRRVVASLPERHPLSVYARGTDVHSISETDIVDAFLNRHEHSYTVDEILSIVNRSGLIFQGWWDNLDYYPDASLGNCPVVHDAVARLLREMQWPVVELLNARIGRHRFLVRANGQDKAAMRIPFAGDDISGLVPGFRRGLKTARGRAHGIKISREWHQAELHGWQKDMLLAIDGRSTAAQIGALRSADPAEVNHFFETLWRQGHVTLARQFH